MVGIRNIIAPARGEQIVNKEGVLEPRAQNFVELLTEQVKAISEDIIVLEGTTNIVVTGTFTTSGNMTIICEAPSTITLEPTPRDGTRVEVTRLSGSVTVKSDVVNIVYKVEESEMLLNRDGTVLNFTYIAATQLWYVS
jgi:hypothetical protein